MKRLMVLLALLALAATAAPPSKPAWQWTIEERLASRADPAAAAERLQAAIRSGHLSSPKLTAAELTATHGDFIDGKRNPELLLPGELFDAMMAHAFRSDPDTQSAYREAKGRLLPAYGLPPDFFSKLELMSIAYLSDWRQLTDLHKSPVRDQAVRKRIAAQTEGLQLLVCGDRTAAIQAARQEFGERFDRFLYGELAPTMTISIAKEGISAQRHRETEEGCQ